MKADGVLAFGTKLAAFSLTNFAHIAPFAFFFLMSSAISNVRWS